LDVIFVKKVKKRSGAECWFDVGRGRKQFWRKGSRLARTGGSSPSLGFEDVRMGHRNPILFQNRFVWKESVDVQRSQMEENTFWLSFLGTSFPVSSH
jgi:hypothetical protein